MVNNQLYVIGGSETYMFSLGDELVRIGHQVEYFGLEDPDKMHGNQYGIYAVKSKNPLSYISNKKNVNKFGEILDRYKPDIVHLNLVYFTLTEDIVYEAKKRNIPIIHTIHDSKIVCPCHRLYIEQKGIPCKDCLINDDFNFCVKNRCIKGSYLKSKLAVMESFYYKKKGTYSEIDKYIFVSQFMMNEHIGRGVNKSQSLVLHNFSRVNKKSALEKAKDRYVIYFGRLGREKGTETLVDVCRSSPQINYKIVGTGEMEYLFKDLDNCEVLGFKKGKELEDLVSMAVCSVLPSIWYENCPMTILESIALGTPVIGSNIGGIPELINHGKTGFIFESGNAIDLRNKIESIYFNDSLSYEMAKNCLSDCQLMGVSDYADKIINIYNSVLNSGKK